MPDGGIAARRLVGAMTKRKQRKPPPPTAEQIMAARIGLDPVILPRVELTTFDDPDDHNVRARKPWQVTTFRRRDGLTTMWRAKHITREQYIAGERFRRDLELSTGAKEASAGTGVRVSGGGDYEPSMTQLDAQTRVRLALQAIGMIASAVVLWVVDRRGTLEGYAEEYRIRRQRVSDLWRAGMDRLVAHYGLD